MLEKLNKAISEEDSSTALSEPSSSNSDHDLEVIGMPNPTSEISEDGNHGSRRKFICNLDYVCISLLMQLSQPFQIYYC